MKLNARQKLFVAAYLKNKNYTEAYIAAGYSKKTAYSAGPRMGESAAVKAAIAEALAEQVVRLELKADRVLLELMRIGYVDLGQAFGPNGRLLSWEQMPEDVRRAIAGVDTEELDGKDSPPGKVLKVRFNDKLRALELLGKHLKLFADQLQIKDVTPISEELKRATLEQLLELARSGK